MTRRPNSLTNPQHYHLAEPHHHSAEPDLLEELRRIPLYAHPLMGAGGGGKGGGGGAVATEDPDTLVSGQTARVLFVLGEGEMELAQGLQGVTFDGTPVLNDDDSANFTNYEIYFASGTVDQDFIPNFTDEEDTQGVGVRLRHGGTGYVHTVAAGSADQTRITMRFPRLQTQDKKTGDVHGTSVQVKISVRENGGSYSQVILDTIKGKASSPYLRSYLIGLTGDGPWDVKVERLTPDSTSEALSNDTYVDSYSDIILSKLSHPNTSLLGVGIDAQYFSAMPTVAARCKGVRLLVPTNYDPVARTYATTGPGTTGGAWDGTFKTAYSNNPAWGWYRVATHTRYGVGDLINVAQINKYALYDIGKYCDQSVPDGYGGMEPRFTMNLYLTARNKAMQVLQDMASVFRAMLSYVNGAIVPVQNAPIATLAHQFTPDNIEGGFSYAGTAGRARHTAAIVWWNNMDNQGIAEPEEVEDEDAIAKLGYNPITVTAFGCTSRGQAHRLGRWMLLTEKVNTETVTFKTGQDGMSLLPGDLISCQVPWRSGAVNSGRLVSATTSTLVLDKSVTLVLGRTYGLQVLNATTGEVMSTSVVTGPGAHTTLGVFPAFPSAPAADTVWVLAASDLVPELHVVLRQVPESHEKTIITALNYNESKFDAVDLGDTLDFPPTSKLPPANKCLPPGTVTITETAGTAPDGGLQRQLQVTWVKSPDYYIRGYRVSYRVNNGNFVPLSEIPSTAVTIPFTVIGTYDIIVYAVNQLGVQSVTPASASYTTDASNPLPLFGIAGLELVGGANSLVFTGRDAHFDWRLTSPTLGTDEIDDGDTGDTGYDPAFSEFLVYVRDWATKKIIFQTTRAQIPNFIFTYELNAGVGLRRKFDFGVAAADVYGGGRTVNDIVWLNGVSNPAPAFLTGIDPSYAVLSTKVRFDTPFDLDYEGVIAWRSTESGFTPGPTTEVWRGKDNPMLIPQGPGTIWYYRFAAYDAFTSDPALLNISGEFPITNQYLTETDFTQELRDRFGIIDDISAQIILIQQTITDDESAFAQQISAVVALVGDNSAAIINEQNARADADTAFADDLTTVQATVDNNTALIALEMSTRADADTSMSTLIQTVAAIADQNTADITTEHNAWVNAVAAEASLRTSADVDFTNKLASRPNQLQNGGFETGDTDPWLKSGVVPTVVTTSSVGAYVHWVPADTPSTVLYQDIPAQAGQIFTGSGDLQIVGTAGVMRFYLQFLDSAKAGLGSYVSPQANIGTVFDTTGLTRYAFQTVAAPTGTAWVRMGIQTLNTVAAHAYARLVKVERGALPATPYTMEGAAIVTNASVSEEISARIDQYGQLSAQWGVQIDVNGRITGLIQLSGDNTETTFTIAADKFFVVDPDEIKSPVPVFSIYTGATKAELVVGAPERSSNFVSGVSGARIDWLAGTAEFVDGVFSSNIGAPVVSPGAQTINDDTVALTVSNIPTGWYVRYTTTGADATATSTLWPGAVNAWGTLTMGVPKTLKVCAFNLSTNPTKQSPQWSGTYTRGGTTGNQSASPALSVTGGNGTGDPKNCTFTLAGATIYTLVSSADSTYEAHASPRTRVVPAAEDVLYYAVQPGKDPSPVKDYVNPNGGL